MCVVVMASIAIPHSGSGFWDSASTRRAIYAFRTSLANNLGAVSTRTSGIDSRRLFYG